MPRLELALVAHSYSVDAIRNTLSIFDLIEGFTVPQATPVPTEEGQHVQVGPPFALITIWSREPSEDGQNYEGRVTVMNPKGVALGAGTFKLEMENNSRARVMVRVPFLPYVGTGEYRFLIELRVGDAWETLGEKSLPVLIGIN